MKMFIGNYDGRREGLIIAKSKSAAAKIAGCSVRTFNNYWSEATRVIQVNGVGDFEPDTLYTRSNQTWGGTFFKGKCPL